MENVSKRPRLGTHRFPTPARYLERRISRNSQNTFASSNPSRCLSSCISSSRQTVLGINTHTSVTQLEFISGGQILAQSAGKINLVDVANEEKGMVDTCVTTLPSPISDTDHIFGFSPADFFSPIALNDPDMPTILYRLSYNSSTLLGCSIAEYLKVKRYPVENSESIKTKQYNDVAAFKVRHRGNLVYLLQNSDYKCVLHDTRESVERGNRTQTFAEGTDSFQAPGDRFTVPPLLSVLEDDRHVAIHTPKNKDSLQLYDLRKTNRYVGSLKLVGKQRPSVWNRFLNRYDTPFSPHSNTIVNWAPVGTSMILTMDQCQTVKLWNLSTLSGVQTFDTYSTHQSEEKPLWPPFAPLVVCPATQGRFYMPRSMSRLEHHASTGIVEYSLRGSVPSPHPKNILGEKMENDCFSPQFGSVVSLAMNKEGSALAAGFMYRKMCLMGVC